MGLDVISYAEAKRAYARAETLAKTGGGWWATVMAAPSDTPTITMALITLAAPQARLMATMVEAVLGAQLPWDLLVMGGSDRKSVV